MTIAPPSPTVFLELALRYLELGWQVFPVVTRGKLPLTKHGLLEATDDEEQVRAWAKRWPNANVGVRTGEESGFWVFDVDKGGPQPDGTIDPSGYETLESLEHLHGRLEAPFAETGGGGRHYFFTYDGSLDIPSRAKLMPGLDCRARGGYIVAPGSIHPCGEPYRVAEDIDLTRLPAAPNWLLEIVCGPTHATRNVVEPPPRGLTDKQMIEIRSALESFPSDDREVWLRVGMALHSTRGGHAARELWDEWSQRSTKFEADVQEKTWSAFTLGRKNDIGLPSLFQLAYDAGWTEPKMPEPEVVAAPAKSEGWQDPEWIWRVNETPKLDLAAALPESLTWFRTWIEDISRVLQTPPEFTALLALGMVSGAVAGRYEIALEDAEWVEPAQLWVLCAMPSGALKSPTYKALAAPFYAYDGALDQNREIAAWQGKVMVAETVLANVQGKLKQQACKGADLEDLEHAAGEAMLSVRLAHDARPPLRDIVGSSFTTPAMVKWLQDHDERCLILDPEGSIFRLVLAGSSDLERDLDPWLKSYSCEPIKEIRIGSGTKESATRYVRHPSLAIAACTQPENLAMFRDRYAEGRGFLARFIVAVFPYKLPAKAIVRERLPEASIARWSEEVTRLLSMPKPVEPLRVLLCDEGAAAFEAWASLWLSKARGDLSRDEGSAVGYASAFGSKLRGMAMRLILTLHALENENPHHFVPSLELVRCVLDGLVPFIRAHVERLSVVIRDDPAIKLAERLLRWIVDAGLRSFSRTQAFNGLRSSSVTKVDDLNASLCTLTDAGWIRPVGKLSTKAAGFQPAARRYETHPRAVEHLAAMAT